MDNRDSGISNNLLWKLVERFGIQIISFIVSIIIARILEPNEYGTIAVVIIFIDIANVFVDGGFGNALIQKKECKDVDYSSVYRISTISSLILYITIFVFSPYIAEIYSNDSISLYLRVLGVRILISPSIIYQTTYISKMMQFKKLSLATISGTMLAAIIGLVSALIGLGIWALILMNIIQPVVTAAILMFIIPRCPKAKFSMTSIKEVFNYGWKIFVSSLLGATDSSIRQMIVGKVYTNSDLAYYNKGIQFPNIIMTSVNSSINAVLFPAMSLIQNDQARLLQLTRSYIRIASYLIWPIMTGLFCVAQPLVRLLLTDKWISCVPYIQIYCAVYSLQVMQYGVQNMIKATGRSGLFLKMDLISYSLSFLLIMLLYKYNVLFIAITAVIVAVINVIIKIIISKRLYGYKYSYHASDNMIPILMSLTMGFVVWFVGRFFSSVLVCVLIQIIVGVTVYFILSLIIKPYGYLFIVGKIKGFRKNMELGI